MVVSVDENIASIQVNRGNFVDKIRDEEKSIESLRDEIERLNGCEFFYKCLAECGIEYVKDMRDEEPLVKQNGAHLHQCGDNPKHPDGIVLNLTQTRHIMLEKVQEYKKKMLEMEGIMIVIDGLCDATINHVKLNSEFDNFFNRYK